MAIAFGSATLTPGSSWSIPAAENICFRLTHGLNNPSMQILAAHLADGDPCLILNRH